MFLRLLVLSAVLFAPIASAAGPIDPDRLTGIVGDEIVISSEIVDELTGAHEILGMICIDPESDPPIAYGPCIRDVCGGLENDGMRDGDAVDIPVLCA